MEKKPLVILTGPTAVGKTALSIALAHMVNGEIISADSMQVYRHMDIGSAKIRPEEMNGVPHHLVDVLEPNEPFNVVVFQQMVKEAMEGIYARGHVPVLVGGTGFYIQAIVNDIDFTESEDDTEFRRQCERMAAEGRQQELFEQLKEVDPASAEVIHPNNVKRVIRALEFYHLTGQRISEHNEEQKNRTSPYNFAYFVLQDDRPRLYEKIDRRVDIMLQDGLVEEVKELMAMGCTRCMVSMQGLGYKEIIDYLEGKCTLEEAVYTIKRDTRHFAKRQITWFKREKDVIWVNKPDFNYKDEEICAFMRKVLQEKGIMTTC